jgi:hypothetical protein
MPLSDLEREYNAIKWLTRRYGKVLRPQKNNLQRREKMKVERERLISVECLFNQNDFPDGSLACGSMTMQASCKMVDLPIEDWTGDTITDVLENGSRRHGSVKRLCKREFVSVGDLVSVGLKQLGFRHQWSHITDYPIQGTLATLEEDAGEDAGALEAINFQFLVTGGMCLTLVKRDEKFSFFNSNASRKCHGANMCFSTDLHKVVHEIKNQLGLEETENFTLDFLFSMWLMRLIPKNRNQRNHACSKISLKKEDAGPKISNSSQIIQVAIKCLCRERMQSNPMKFLKKAAIMHSIDHDFFLFSDLVFPLKTILMIK